LFQDEDGEGFPSRRQSSKYLKENLRKHSDVGSNVGIGVGDGVKKKLFRTMNSIQRAAGNLISRSNGIDLSHEVVGGCQMSNSDTASTGIDSLIGRPRTDLLLDNFVLSVSTNINNDQSKI
jgi:hypothetical protein